MFIFLLRDGAKILPPALEVKYRMDSVRLYQGP